MHEAFWNGLLDVRWEDAPLGPETTRLVLRLRECGYAERTCRDYGHAVIHLGRVLREETGSVEGVRDDAVIEDGRFGGKRANQAPRLRHLEAAASLVGDRGIVRMVLDECGDLGAAAVAAYTRGHGEAVVIPPQAWAGGLAATVVIGALAGLLPAIRAARLSPTQALWTV